MGSEETAAFDGKAFCKALPAKPGVYRMLDADERIIYVGKARNLKSRVSSYFLRTVSSSKTAALVAQICAIEITITRTESEALILENTLIKEHRPRYNILLRDDKSYPYILLSDKDKYPRLSFHRGKRSGGGQYFGPYPGAGAVRETLNLLQKLFQVRQCDDNFFKNRSRPCLQYQIKRCSGPCVGLVSQEKYLDDVRHTSLFLKGKNNEVIDALIADMERASKALAFERAATLRDQIASLRKVQERQYVSGEKGDIDVIAGLLKNGVSCIDVFHVRSGHNLGNKTFFPKHAANAEMPEIMSAFLTQHYPGKLIPSELLLNVEPDDGEFVASLLSEEAGRNVKLTTRLAGERARWLDMAVTNAQQNLSQRLSSRQNLSKRFQVLQEVLGLDELPKRIECFDISHSSGKQTVASCVVFNGEGALKSDYRRFNIEGITPGDDYAAMYQALTRRYTRLKKGEGKLPDILLIDGGKGQVSQAVKVLEELQINDVMLLGIAKGPGRKPGLETLHIAGLESETRLEADSPALHLIQQIRDEAHRFAITGHRQRRQKAQNQSILESIPGVGAQRRRELLRQFGGLQGVSSTGVEELMKIKGINRALAQRIYDTFHADNN